MSELDAEHLTQLAAKYPRLFPAGRRPHRSRLQRGWAPIVDALMSSIDKRLDDDRVARFFIFRIGDKSGRLHIDADLFSRDADGNLQPLESLPEADAAVEQEILRLIEGASQRSAATCQGCGMASSIRSVDGDVSTLCDACHAQRLPSWRRPRSPTRSRGWSCITHACSMAGFQPLSRICRQAGRPSSRRSSTPSTSG